MEVVDTRGLLFQVRQPEKVLTAIKHSAVVEESDAGNFTMVAKWTLENCRRLSNLGITKVPSTIERDYDWPGTHTPYAHQKVTAGFLTNNNRAYCFSSQGTGKTAAVIWAADYLLTIGDVTRVLVICPLSIVDVAWMNDLFTTAMHRTAAVAHGTREQRVKVIEGDYEFVIINFDGVNLIKNEARNKFDLIVVDEANFLKTATTNRWKAVNSLINPETKVWMLTGTPAAQSPLDAFGLAKLATPHRVPRYFGAWRDKVMNKLTKFKWVPKYNATTIVNAALQPAIRFAKEDCIDLPPLVYQTRHVELTKQQQLYYTQLKRKLLIQADGERVSAVHAASELNKLLQISCGAVYSDSGEVLEFDARNRLKEVTEIVREASHKTLVFVPFRHAITCVAEHLEKEGFTVEIVRGGVSKTERKRIFTAFQSTPDPHVLVIQPQSAAHGLTLTAANTIVWYGPVPSVETWLQANERINRPSQENKMTVVKIYGSAVEKQVYAALESRTLDQSKLVSIYEAALRD